ncbi:membrane-spanning protein, partial [Clostridium tetanomorphum DSM 665]
YKIIILIIKLLLFIDILENYLIKNYYFVLIGLVALILTFLPEILAKILKTKLNELMSFSIVFFMFISLYLGTLKNFYRFIWWDTMLHLISRLILGLLAIVLMENLNMENFSSHLLNPKFIFLYILSFVALCGVIWEIYEFTVDTLFGLDMQGA